jgi:hypothetical protein
LANTYCGGGRAQVDLGEELCADLGAELLHDAARLEDLMGMSVIQKMWVVSNKPRVCDGAILSENQMVWVAP